MSMVETKTNHFISIEKAKQLTRKFKDNKKKIVKDEFKDKDLLPNSETFDRAAFDRLLKQPGCAGLRFYFGMENDDKVTLVVVGVDENGNDMLKPIPKPSSTNILALDDVKGFDDPVVENGVKCPPTCPVDSPLNN
jgi:hypothetical protein